MKLTGFYLIAKNLPSTDVLTVWNPFKVVCTVYLIAKRCKESLFQQKALILWGEIFLADCRDLGQSPRRLFHGQQGHFED